MCKHLNGEFSEFATIENFRYYENGKLQTLGNNNIGNITGYLFVCSECSSSWRFKANPKQKFLQRVCNQLDDLNKKEN